MNIKSVYTQCLTHPADIFPVVKRLEKTTITKK